MAAAIQAVFTDPQVTLNTTQALNESFKLNLYKFNNYTTHNVDMDFAAHFFEDLAAERHFDCLLVPRTVVPFETIQESLLMKIEVVTTPHGHMLRVYFILLLNLQLLLP